MERLGKKLWQPSQERKHRSNLTAYSLYLKRRGVPALTDYRNLHRWSVENTSEFWSSIVDFCGVAWQHEPTRTWDPPPSDQMRGGKWFRDGRLNFAENLLQVKGSEVAIIGVAEGRDDCAVSWDELRLGVFRMATLLQRSGVEAGDRVAGVVANVPEAVIAMLATAAIGGVWVSCSPDFGAEGIIDRLCQVEPKFLFFTKSYRYGGRSFDCESTVQTVLSRISSIERCLGIDHLGKSFTDSFQQPPGFAPSGEESTFAYVPRAFDDPLYIMFSSGTTGVPKCITHGIGGTLIQHKKELMLHCDIFSTDRVLYYTTCGWMMWNWMVSGLSLGASIVTVDGSPGFPCLDHLWESVAKHRVTVFGTSPKFISTCIKENVQPKKSDGSATPKAILSTGSPLLPEHFEWVYRNFPEVHLASICGGTDIISCFMLGNPWTPVYAGEIQGPGLGMAIESWTEDGEPAIGAKGELVCTRPFPSMPVCFWNDPKGQKYTEAYFAQYGEGTWRHGDYIEITESGGIVVYGRSDATLNPGGVRIGTAEIYRQVEALNEIQDSIAISQTVGDDTVIVLFVKLAPGLSIDLSLKEKIRGVIRDRLTPRHVPKIIEAVADIPYTRSGKKVELAVVKAVNGLEVKNLGALANPGALSEFEGIAKEWV